MKTIKYLIGDATHPIGIGNKIIVHICNDIGRWGKGFVLALSKRSKLPETAFHQWYADRKSNDYGLGATQFIQINADIWVANVIGQHKIAVKGDPHIPVRYEAIESGLIAVADKAIELTASIHLPRIGCGLAGGKWEVVEPIIIDRLCKLDLEVTVYDLE
jgi:O-acetyl-ADP-ribose deacetylase (regulator of RNase III)